MKKYPPRGSDLHVEGVEVQRPIFGLDIDGTLGLYHEHFWSFACAWTGKELRHPDYYTGGSFAAHLGLAKSTYRKIKLAYRRGGAKRSMPVVDGASELARSLRSRGAIVVLCTTRPYLSLEGIDEDTRHWAKRNKIGHDFIIWGENKYRDLARFGDRVVAVLEDEPVMHKQAVSQGIRTFAPIRQYNMVGQQGVTFCPDLAAANNCLNLELDDWELKYR
jgi:hypothetical protein